MKYSQGGEEPHDFQSLDFSKITNIIVIGLVIYLAFLLCRSVLENYEVNQEISGIRREISEIERENQKLASQIDYYNSDLFVEIEARAKLGYQKPGEKVIILPKSKKEEAQEQEINLPTKSQKKIELPNYIQWWRLFFQKTS